MYAIQIERRSRCRFFAHRSRQALAAWLLAVLASLPQPLLAAPPEQIAQLATQQLKIDGKLDEPAWATAKVTDRFTQKAPTSGAAPTERTAFRVLYDADAIYVGIECVQKRTPIIRRLTRRDRWVESDMVSVGIDSRRDRTTAFEFSLSAAGVQTDTIRFDDTESSDDWDEVWEGAVALTADGWSAELRIPLRVLRFDVLPVQDFGLQVRRYLAAKEEIDEWSFIPRTESGEVSRYGRLLDLRGLLPGHRWELRPFAVGRVEWLDLNTDPLARTKLALTAGLDFKLHVTQNLTLDGTINPDFGQVEADEVVLNLTSYEVFYPEKRQFFLEGIDTFATPLQVLYTRRIGRPPAVPVLLADETTDETPRPAMLYGAAKLVGTIGRRLTVGALSAVAAPSEIQVHDGFGGLKSRISEPLALWHALRMKLAIGDNGHLGLLVTAVNHVEKSDDFVRMAMSDSRGQPQRLCPNGDLVGPETSCYSGAYVVSLDGRWRSRDGAYVASGQALVSLLQGGPARSYLDGTVIHPGGLAPGAYLRLAKEGGGRFLGGAELTYASRGLDYNDLGFMPRQNVLRTIGSIEFRNPQPWGRTLDMRAKLWVYDRESLDWLNLGRGVGLFTQWRLRNFWMLFTQLQYQGASFDDREVGDGTALERAAFYDVELGVRSDPRKPFSVFLWGQAQFRENGALYALYTSLALRPISRLDIQLEPQFTYTAGEPRYIGAGPKIDQLLLGRLAAASAGATLRATWTFTPRLTLQLYTQLLLEARHFDDFSLYSASQVTQKKQIRLVELVPTSVPITNPDSAASVINLNAVLRWEYLPGSVLFLVYTRSQAPSAALAMGDVGALDLGLLRIGPAADAIMMKLSYWIS